MNVVLECRNGNVFQYIQISSKIEIHLNMDKYDIKLVLKEYEIGASTCLEQSMAFLALKSSPKSFSANNFTQHYKSAHEEPVELPPSKVSCVTSGYESLY